MTKRVIKTFIILGVCLSFLTVLALTEASLHKKEDRPGIVYWHGDSSQKTIALTFDDGPQSVYTPQVLDILKRYDVRATFFLIGKNVEIFPELAKRILEEGHSIGNHTYTHPDLRLQNKEQIKEQMLKTEKAIRSVTGYKPHLFRPPYGMDSKTVFLEAKNLGYVVVKWSVSGLNGRQDAPFNKIVKRVIDNTQNGSIILLHDGNRLFQKTDRSQIVKALPIIIETLRAEGYRFVTIDELISQEA